MVFGSARGVSRNSAGLAHKIRVPSLTHPRRLRRLRGRDTLTRASRSALHNTADAFRNAHSRH